jgi:Rrf2 family protein
VLQLTTRGNYGILAVYYIAQQAKEGFISIDEIAENSQIPKPYLSKILQDLCRGGVLLSRRGTGGGFALARPSQEISLKDVIEVIEGKIYIVNCLLSPSRCGNSGTCPISPMWLEVQNFIVNIIESITFEDIVVDEKKQKILGLLEMCRTMYQEKFQALRAGKQHSEARTLDNSRETNSSLPKEEANIG